MSRTVDRPERPYLESRQLDDLMRINSELLAELWVPARRSMPSSQAARWRQSCSASATRWCGA
jgi:hypothetical protein